MPNVRIGRLAIRMKAAGASEGALRAALARGLAASLGGRTPPTAVVEALAGRIATHAPRGRRP